MIWREPHLARRFTGGFQLQGLPLFEMANILRACPSGATLITDPMHTKKPQSMDIVAVYVRVFVNANNRRNVQCTRTKACYRPQPSR
jgi:hypothetical protein